MANVWVGPNYYITSIHTQDNFTFVKNADSVAKYTYVKSFTTSSEGTGAEINISFTTGSTYAVEVANPPGSGYTQNETLLVAGTDLGGTSPTNDATVTIDTIGGSGEITGASVTGTGGDAATYANTATQNYLVTLQRFGEIYPNPTEVLFDAIEDGIAMDLSDDALVAALLPKINTALATDDETAKTDSYSATSLDDFTLKI